MRQIFISLLAFGHFGGFAQSGPEDCISSIDGNTGDWGIVNFIKGQSFTLPTNINNIQISLLVCESSNFKANIQALPSGDGNEWQSGFVFGTDSLQPQGIDDLWAMIVVPLNEGKLKATTCLLQPLSPR